jgi:polyhydroxyalkanoate synthesis regulator protein
MALQQSSAQAHLIKRYGSRLYNFTTAAYVSADQLRALRAEGVHVVVIDADTDEHITEEVLTEEVLEAR